MHKNRQRETKQVFTKRKIGKHLVNIAMLGLTLTPAVSAISSVYAEEAANDATASTDVSAQLKAAIEKAKSLGIKVDSTEKKTFQSTAELNDFNAKQLARLNEAIAKAESDSDAAKKNQEAYDIAKKKYDEDKKKYDAEKAKYDAEIAKMEANKNKEGHLSQAVAQSLMFTSEPNATAKIKGQQHNIKESSWYSKVDVISRYASDGYTDADYASDVSLVKNALEGAPEVKSYPVIMKSGSTVEVEYSNLQNTSYRGKKISKVVYKYTPKSKLNRPIVASIFQDPAMTIRVSSKLYEEQIDIDMEISFYYEDGSKVNFSQEDAALVSFASMNSSDNLHGSKGFYREYVKNLSNIEFIGISGSTVKYSNGVIQADKDNNIDNGTESSPYYQWDNPNNPKAYYGAGVGRMIGDTFKFTFGATIDAIQWFQFNSKILNTDAIVKPTPPTPPTQKITNNTTDPINVKIAEAVVLNTTHVEVGTNKELAPQEEGTKPKKNIDGYEFVETKTKDGNTIHYYTPKKPEPKPEPKPDPKPDDKKVFTKHIDITTGKELHPQEEGTKPKRSFDGYEFVETKTKDGNTIHYYKPVDKTPIKPKEDKAITKHFDITTGKEIAPQEDGNQPKKNIPNYEFVETKTKTGETDHYYKPISKPITRHIDKDTGKDIVPPEDGNKPKKDIPDYRFVETKDKDGNTYHYYQKVHTRHYDITTGKELVPQEDGTQPKKDIPNYEFVETKDKDGDTEHFYRPIKKVYTKHIDKKTGKELVPQEDGKQPKKDIPGYRFVETKDEDGNTIHYYEQVITKHLEVGTNKELAPQEDGQQPKKDIEGYEFVETKDENGDTIHYYKPVKKVYTKHIDKSTGKELAPQEDGKQPKRDFDGYKFVETKDEDGNTIHYYEPIAKVITKHIDIDTNEEIAPQEDGKQPKKDISDYEFVETKDDNGNTLHYYRKVKKPAAIKGKTPAKYADTNEAAGIVQSVIGALGLTSLAGFGFWKKRKK